MVMKILKLYRRVFGISKFSKSKNSAVMAATTVIDLPEFDTGRYEGCDFLMSDGCATLTLKLAEIANFSIRFDRFRWHQFTVLPNCTTEMIKDAYFRLVEYKDSPNVTTLFIATNRAVRHIRSCITIVFFLMKQDAMKSMLNQQLPFDKWGGESATVVFLNL